MMRSTPLRIITLALGFWIAFAPTLLAVPTAPMAMQMSMSDGAGSGDCNGCPDAGMDRNICAAMCANALLFAIVPERGSQSPVVFRAVDWPGLYLPLTGRFLVPDPGPPRSA